MLYSIYAILSLKLDKGVFESKIISESGPSPSMGYMNPEVNENLETPWAYRVSLI